MSDLETLFLYSSERGAYVLPMASIVILISYFVLGRLIRKFIHKAELRVLLYISSSSLISSIVIYRTGFSGNNMFIEEIPYFMLSGMVVLYIVYLPIYIIKKLIKAKKSGVKTA